MSDFDELEKRLRVSQQGTLLKYSDRIKLIEGKRPWIVAVGVLAATIAALSRLPDGSAGPIMAISGGVVAALSGLLVAWFDYRKLEIGVELRNAEHLAEDSIAKGRSVTARLSLELARVTDELQKAEVASEARNAHRVSMLLALQRMNEVAERFDVEASSVAVIEAMLDAALTDINDAFGFTSRDHWTFSIFSREKINGQDVMHRRISRWCDRKAETGDMRDWAVGEGYTGYAWQQGDDVIEPDTSDPVATRYYRVPASKQRADDAREIMSVVAVPIKSGIDEEVVGVITVTSNRTGQFLRDLTDPRAQNVDLVRQIEAIVAVQIAIRRKLGQGVFNSR